MAAHSEAGYDFELFFFFHRSWVHGKMHANSYATDLYLDLCLTVSRVHKQYEPQYTNVNWSTANEIMQLSRKISEVPIRLQN